MTTLGFSGTRSVRREKAESILSSRAQWIGMHDKFVTGACQGWDAYAGEWLLRAYPDRAHVVVVPGTRSQVDYWWKKPDVVAFIEEHGVLLEIVEMPGNSTYKQRNRQIVNRSHVLFYCAEYPETDGFSTRSGTWQTVRLARGGIPVEGVILCS